ncbi:MAG: alpha/beta hydrolase family protein [Egibacteraceae bacterium]
MITVSSQAAPVISDRFNFAFSENGRYGVCLRTDGEDMALESWMLTSEEAARRTIPNLAVDRETYALPLDDGQILLFHRGGRSTSGRHELVLLQPGGSDFCLQGLGEVPALPGGYLLPSPDASTASRPKSPAPAEGPSSAPLGFAVALDDPEHSTIWRLSASSPWIEPIVRVPGSLSGGVWLDGDEGVVALNQTRDGCRSSGIAVDLPQRSWRRIWSVSDTSTDRIVLYSPRSKVLVVTTNASGEERLGWGLLGEPAVRFPEALHRPGYVRRALALDDRGERLLVHEVAGATSRLFIYTLADDRLRPLVGPPGTVSSPASWAGDLVRLRFSTPSQPPTLATARLGIQPCWSLSRDRELENHAVWADAELIELQGPAGPIEAIVYGGPDWRRRQHLVVALHGGPLASWRFEFDSLFQCLAAANVAVVAPNYRGSTGYGDEHLRAVVGNWGGPDLDDVLALGRSLENERGRLELPRPVVLGVSYGAFLALLAACNEPELWSACVALAPFLSGPRLYKGADAAVRNRVEQLGGLKQVDDAIWPRDVLQACASLSAPLLLIHGTDDATIPVGQSRMLRQRLLELGRIEGVDFEYLEVDSDHTGVILTRWKALRQRVVCFCLARSGLEFDNPTTSFTRSGRR